MDTLADVFARTRLGGAVVCRSLLRAPWAIRFDEAPRVGFHLVTEGTCWLTLEGRAPQRLETGDLALLNHGSRHVLASEAGAPGRPLEHWLGGKAPSDETVISGGGSGARCVVVCGAYLGEEGARLLFSQLPPVLVARTYASSGAEPVASLMHLLMRELEQAGPGRSALLNRYLEALLVHVLRDWLANAPSRARGWLPALADPQVARALTLMHERPGSSWSVPQLARRAGLSRATFARRFQARVGVSPGVYLTRWRVEVAAQLLRETTLSLAEVADRVGYASEFAFSRVFRRHKGAPPGRYRRQRAQ